MIQTTLFNYFTCNNEQLKQQPKHKLLSSLKQANLTHYFKTIPKKKNLILDYFKQKEEKKEEEKVFDLVLVDIKNTSESGDVTCIKKNMYDSNLKYISISYRWGECDEQLLETPDYTAHITSFHLWDLIKLCDFIKIEPDLKDIPYLWIDAISVDQQNHERKKETILKMSDIYKNASYMLAVPDMHCEYLRKNTANDDVMNLVYKYGHIIFEDIINPVTNHMQHNIKNSISDSTQHTNNHHHHYSTFQKLIHNNRIKEIEELRKEIEELREENEKLEVEIKENEIKKIYRFLAYLVNDWSNRAWVVSEYQVAKEKYEQHGTPLKYMFISLLHKDRSVKFKPFFSYSFIGQHNTSSNAHNSTNTRYFYVDNGSKFIQFLESRFIQQPHINMMIGSNAMRNEDRFYAILPSWKKYKHLIMNKNTVSNWNITDMTSVKLKLYKILDDGDLWDKARLLLACSVFRGKTVLPSFATFSQFRFVLNEIDAIDSNHKHLLDSLSGTKIEISEKYNNIKEYIIDYNKKHGTIFKQNLIDIQFNQQQCYLSVNASQIFIFNKLPKLNQEELSRYSLNDNDDLKLIFIPFFTYAIPELSHFFPLSDEIFPALSGILLLGNMDINRWIVYQLYKCETYGKPSLISNDDYIFRIY